jgi:hypothetical protein
LLSRARIPDTGLHLTGAVARVKMHTDFVRQRAVFTLTSEGGGWRIVGKT